MFALLVTLAGVSLLCAAEEARAQTPGTSLAAASEVAAGGVESGAIRSMPAPALAPLTPEVGFQGFNIAEDDDDDYGSSRSPVVWFVLTVILIALLRGRPSWAFYVLPKPGSALRSPPERPG